MAADAESKPRKVMVAIDESDCSSRNALEWVLANLRDSFSPSPLVVLTVQPFPDAGSMAAASLGSHPELIQILQDNEKTVSLDLLEWANKICAKHGVNAETICKVGDPKEVICETINKLNIDLLAVGSHGKGALTRVFLGSVSNYCVNNANCPVLVVKSK